MDYLKNSNARQRLQKARDAASRANKNNGTASYTWRDFRPKFTRGYSGMSAGFNSDGYGRKIPVWSCFAESDIPAHSVDFADEVYKGIEHTGWFADDDQMSGTIRGIVCRLDGRKWLAGYHWTDTGEYVIRADEVHEDVEDAAISADSFAEGFAEICREDARKFQEAQSLQEENETSLQRLRECLALRHRTCMDYVRDEIRDLCETIRGNRARLSEEFAEFI